MYASLGFHHFHISGIISKDTLITQKVINLLKAKIKKLSDFQSQLL